MALKLNFWNREKKESFLEIFNHADLTKLQIEELLIEHAIDLIAKTIAKSEIEVFRYKDSKIKKVIDDIYYSLNIRPNLNEDGTVFIYNVISTLLRENEALVVRLDSKLYLATRWDRSKNIINGKTYSDVVITDNELNEIKLNKIINSDDAVYMSLGNSQINDTLEKYNSSFAEMLKASVQGYKRSNYIKYKLQLPTTLPIIKDPKTEKVISMDEYIKALTGNLLEDNDSVVGISSSFNLDQLGKDKPQDSKDIRDMTKDLGDKIAMSFNIPLDIYWGEKTEKSTGTNDFITFAVLPILNIVEDAFNGKLIEKDSYLKGERIKFDKFTMKHFDIMDVASSLDKLFAIGWSHNDLKEVIGIPKIDEEWADKHHVTKNYMDVESAQRGGE